MFVGVWEGVLVVGGVSTLFCNVKFFLSKCLITKQVITRNSLWPGLVVVKDTVTRKSIGRIGFLKKIITSMVATNLKFELNIVDI